MQVPSSTLVQSSGGPSSLLWAEGVSGHCPGVVCLPYLQIRRKATIIRCSQPTKSLRACSTETQICEAVWRFENRRRQGSKLKKVSLRLRDQGSGEIAMRALRHLWSEGAAQRSSTHTDADVLSRGRDWRGSAVCSP